MIFFVIVVNQLRSPLPIMTFPIAFHFLYQYVVPAHEIINENIILPYNGR